LWLTQAIPMLKPLFAEVHSLWLQASRSAHPVSLSLAAKSSLFSVRAILVALGPDAHLRLHSGHLPCDPATPPSLVIRTDASGVAGQGGGGINITFPALFSVKWTAEELRQAWRLDCYSSTHLEILAVYKALCLWLRSDCVVEVEVDSLDLKQILAKGWSRHPETNKLVQAIVVLVSTANSVLRVRQFSREHNTSADALSKHRLDVRRPVCSLYCAPSLFALLSC
jgi:hypothetical protein